MTETELVIANPPGVVAELERLAAVHDQWLADNPDAEIVTRTLRATRRDTFLDAARVVRESCPPIEPSWEARKAFLDELQRMDNVPW